MPAHPRAAVWLPQFISWWVYNHVIAWFENVSPYSDRGNYKDDLDVIKRDNIERISKTKDDTDLILGLSSKQAGMQAADLTQPLDGSYLTCPITPK
jgi:hypothetical protein